MPPSRLRFPRSRRRSTCPSSTGPETATGWQRRSFAGSPPWECGWSAATFTAGTAPPPSIGGGPQQHSWLRLQDGRILDPTRWAFDRPDKPYLYLGDNDAYDDAGLWLAERSRPMMRVAALLSPDRNAPARAVADRLNACTAGLRDRRGHPRPSGRGAVPQGRGPSP